MWARHGALLLLSIVIALRCSAQIFDPLQVNCAYLDELVIDALNHKRAKKSKPPLVVNEALQKTANYYTSVYVLRKFENTGENKVRFRKNFKKLCIQNGFRTRLIDFSINSCNAINYFGSEFYVDKEDETSNLHLFYGSKKPSKKEKSDEKFKSVPLKQYTYQQLAEIIANSLMHDEGYFKSLNKAYDQIGLSCVVDPKSLVGKKIPKTKIILIVGGRLINW